MIAPCEKITKLLLPAVKIMIIKNLSKKYNLNQPEIAKSLGLTQAAVSKYLSGKYSVKIKKLEKDPKIRKMAALVTESVIKQTSKTSTANEFCKCCSHFLSPSCGCGITHTPNDES